MIYGKRSIVPSIIIMTRSLQIEGFSCEFFVVERNTYFCGIPDYFVIDYVSAATIQSVKVPLQQRIL
jgi:hypothetical protein